MCASFTYKLRFLYLLSVQVQQRNFQVSGRPRSLALRIWSVCKGNVIGGDIPGHPRSHHGLRPCVGASALPSQPALPVVMSPEHPRGGTHSGAGWQVRLDSRAPLTWRTASPPALPPRAICPGIRIFHLPPRTGDACCAHPSAQSSPP